MVRGRWIGLLALLVIASAGLLAAGCGKDSTGPADVTEQPDANDPTGGYHAQNEAPAFGDASLQASTDAENAQNDTMNNDAGVIRMLNADSTHVYILTTLWGILNGDPSAGSTGDGPGDQVDWSGSMTVNRGAIVVASTIAFEQNDYVDARSDPRQVSWVSHTSTSFDGLRVIIYQPFEQGNDGSADSLTIVAGVNTWHFALNDLASFNEIYSVDPPGNKFAIRALRIEPRSSSRGFLAGAWLMDQSGTGGAFRGRWISRNGEVSGFVKGFFATKSNEEKVFFGKYIGRDGAFRGFIRGVWVSTGPDLAGGGTPRIGGTFNGDLLDGSRIRIGSIKGDWRGLPGDAEGFFEGSWLLGLHP